MELSNQTYQEKIIGTIIRNLRKSKRIKLTDLSDELNISSQFLSDIENGRKTINQQTINKVFEKLEVKFNWEIDPYEELLYYLKHIYIFMLVWMKKNV